MNNTNNSIRSVPAERVKTAALRRLATHGPAGLDLTGIGADADVHIDAVHDMFPDRNALLTAMILDAYDGMGAAAEEGDHRATTQGDSPLARWVAICRDARIWAQAHPQQYDLIWGAPLPAYSAPPESMISAGRTAFALIGVLRHAESRGQLRSEPGTTFSDGMGRSVSTLAAGMAAGVPEDVIARLLVAWTQLLGTISFAVYGHVKGFAADPEAFFEHAAESMGRYVGLLR